MSGREPNYKDLVKGETYEVFIKGSKNEELFVFDRLETEDFYPKRGTRYPDTITYAVAAGGQKINVHTLIPNKTDRQQIQNGCRPEKSRDKSVYFKMYNLPVVSSDGNKDGWNIVSSRKKKATVRIPVFCAGC